MEAQVKFCAPVFEWVPVREKLFSVSIKAWRIIAPDLAHDLQGEWRWNVYAHVRPGHPLYGDIHTLLDLPLHGGPNLDEKRMTEPLRGTEHAWQGRHEVAVIGCDYGHLGDEYFSACHPQDGVPISIQHDVRLLAEVLDGRDPRD